jgi:hypothetical protein
MIIDVREMIELETLIDKIEYKEIDKIVINNALTIIKDKEIHIITIIEITKINVNSKNQALTIE